MRTTSSHVLLLLSITTMCLVLNVLGAPFGQHDPRRNEGQYPECDRYSIPYCHRAYFPLCGTDQQTYPNECILCDQNLKNKVNVRIWKRGEC
uniref:trypsin inhibitor ClTI-1-like n=1 Tax=Myxine glutinosa TaxID=7769 RepID=UPI00358EA259